MEWSKRHDDKSKLLDVCVSFQSQRDYFSPSGKPVDKRARTNVLGPLSYAALESRETLR